MKITNDYTDFEIIDTSNGNKLDLSCNNFHFLEIKKNISAKINHTLKTRLVANKLTFCRFRIFGIHNTKPIVKIEYL